jgi:hypothetical protein
MTRVNWTNTIFAVIDMRSFSSLWYWITVGWVWFSATHVVLGVQSDLVQRAARDGGEAMAEVAVIASANAERLVRFMDAAGIWLLVGGSFLLTSLVLLAFWYGVELAQAVVLIALPMTVVLELRTRLAQRIMTDRPGQAVLVEDLSRHRRHTQMIGMVAILATGMAGTLSAVQGIAL